MKRLFVDVDFEESELLEWVNNFETYAAYFSKNASTSYPQPTRFQWIIAVNSKQIIEDLDQLAVYEKKHWLFGFLAYDLKNEFESLKSNNPEWITNKDCLFFVPQYILLKNLDNRIELLYLGSENEANEILTDLVSLKKNKQSSNLITSLSATNEKNNIEAESLINKANYLNSVNQILDQIREGNVYELNYCINIPLEGKIKETLDFQKEILQKLGSPFTAFFKHQHLEIFCTSMERFLWRQGNELLSQPIKGTIKRGENVYQDEALANELRDSEKERAENLMIVDLVRNDLSRICKPGSVQVNKLFSIEAFAEVHQMISSIKGKLEFDIELKEILRALFPMGSMTGAPKIKAMELIEEFEDFKRGIYSGSLGYLMPNGDFDFNVVIRTIIYDNKSKKLNLSVGSAITIDSIPEKEYEECLTKVRKLFKLLNNHLTH